MKDVALHGWSVAPTKTTNDNQMSQGQYIEISQLKRLTKRLDNQDSDLGFKGSSEDESLRVLLNGTDNFLHQEKPFCSKAL